MQKIILLAVVLLFILAGCKATDNPRESTTMQTTTIEATTTEEPIDIPLPLYPPESIQREDQYTTDDFGFLPTMRRAYYHGYGVVDEVYPRTSEMDEAVGPAEMEHMKQIKFYNIPKETFVELLKKEVRDNESYMNAVQREEWELPNPDILYTFDNEIIDAYYRRENPVVPDWTKVKTYESYSAYLAENPQ